MCNWSFKDFAGSIFPWGIRHVGLGRPVPKDVMLAYRNFAFLARRPEPHYQPPEAALLLPDGNRFGAYAGPMLNALYASITALIRLGVPFHVINEDDLATAQMPARALLWPCPYSVDDDAFARVLAFVRNGGHLYLSGSVGFSADRRPDRLERAALLGLPEMTMTPPFPATAPTASRPTLRATVHRGAVWYEPEPIEIRRPERLRDTYRRFLDASGVARSGVKPDDAIDAPFRLPTKSGELLVIVRTDGGDKTFQATVGGVRLTLSLRGRAPAMVWVEQGRLRAASLKGTLDAIDNDGVGRAMLGCTGLAAVAALGEDEDACDLRAGTAILVLPFEPGVVSLTTPRPADAVCLLGDIRDGRWHTLRREALPPHEAVRVDEETYLDLRLVCGTVSTATAVKLAERWASGR